MEINVHKLTLDRLVDRALLPFPSDRQGPLLTAERTDSMLSSISEDTATWR